MTLQKKVTGPVDKFVDTPVGVQNPIGVFVYWGSAVRGRPLFSFDMIIKQQKKRYDMRYIPVPRQENKIFYPHFPDNLIHFHGRRMKDGKTRNYVTRRYIKHE